MIVRTLAVAAIAAMPLALAAIDRAQARTPFDGYWNVTVNGQFGECQGGSYSYAITIANGLIGYGGGDASLSGRVSPSGAVAVHVEAGGRRASGSGRLSRNFGRGSFRGRSANGVCAGVWVAQRRG